MSEQDENLPKPEDVAGTIDFTRGKSLQEHMDWLRGREPDEVDHERTIRAYDELLRSRTAERDSWHDAFVKAEAERDRLADRIERLEAALRTLREHSPLGGWVDRTIREALEG